MIHRFVQRDRKQATEGRLLHIVRGVLVTEKSTMATQAGQYTFVVDLGANKFEIAQAVEKVFDVKVKAVNTLRVPGKAKRFKGRQGMRSSWKKAIVSLAEGSTIDLTVGQSA